MKLDYSICSREVYYHVSRMPTAQMPLAVHLGDPSPSFYRLIKYSRFCTGMQTGSLSVWCLGDCCTIWNGGCSIRITKVICSIGTLRWVIYGVAADIYFWGWTESPHKPNKSRGRSSLTTCLSEVQSRIPYLMIRDKDSYRSTAIAVIHNNWD